MSTVAKQCGKCCVRAKGQEFDWTFIMSSDYDIANQQFSNIIKNCDWCRFVGSITMQTPLLWVPQENFSWYSVLNIFHKVTSVVKFGLYDDSLYQNLLILNQDCWSYFKMYQGSGFWDMVYIHLSKSCLRRSRSHLKSTIRLAISGGSRVTRRDQSNVSGVLWQYRRTIPTFCWISLVFCLTNTNLTMRSS